jgi:hypothetical protein
MLNNMTKIILFYVTKLPLINYCFRPHQFAKIDGIDTIGRNSSNQMRFP